MAAMMTRAISSLLVHRGAPCFAVVLSAVLALPASADWLVTLEGRLIETRGPWKVDGDPGAEGAMVLYVDMEGGEQKIAVARIDLEGSADTTEARTGKRPELPAPPAPAKAAEPGQVAEAEERPDVILYSTSWCGYCRRTRQLLKELDVEFVEKDIEKDALAGREYLQRFGRVGVPVTDVGGEVIKGYSAQLIRKAVKELQRRRAAEDGDG